MSVHSDRVIQVELCEVEQGEAVIKQGEASSTLFIVRSGHIQCYRTQDDGSEQCVAGLVRGDCVGEMDILDGLPSCITCIARERSKLFRLTRDTFERISALKAEVPLRNYIAGTVGRLARVSQSVLHQFVGVRPNPDVAPLQVGAELLVESLKEALSFDVSPGLVLVDSDCVAENFYILISGSIRLEEPSGAVICEATAADKDTSLVNMVWCMKHTYR